MRGDYSDSEGENNSSYKRNQPLRCAQTKEPILPGKNVYHVSFCKGTITTDYAFRPLEESQNRLFSSPRAVHEYTAPREEYWYQRRTP